MQIAWHEEFRDARADLWLGAAGQEWAPPGNLYKYQRKRVRKFAFRKVLTIKEMFLVRQKGKGA